MSLGDGFGGSPMDSVHGPRSDTVVSKAFGEIEEPPLDDPGRDFVEPRSGEGSQEARA